MIMIFTTLATALSGGGSATSAVGIIIFWRVLLGIGIGGDYPMAAVITSEFSSTTISWSNDGSCILNARRTSQLSSKSDVDSSESSQPHWCIISLFSASKMQLSTKL